MFIRNAKHLNFVQRIIILKNRKYLFGIVIVGKRKKLFIDSMCIQCLNNNNHCIFIYLGGSKYN